MDTQTQSAPDALLRTPAFRSTEDRIDLARRCRDCDDIPKVADAGQVRVAPDGTRVQIMHNGLKVEADSYCGPWMTRLIEACRGHHEPQEERLFHEAARALPPDATMIELGGNWAYYSAWFLHGAPGRRCVVLEPDPQNRAAGEQTMRLNGLSAQFVAGIAAAVSSAPEPFETERSGRMELPGFSVPDLMERHGFARLDLLHCDAQGAECAVLEGCRALFAAGRVGLVFVSTHVHAISGDPLTHRRCLDTLRAAGAVIEAEHDAYESFSGDGLIVARFGPAPAGWRLPAISHARRTEALFRDPCIDLAELQAERDAPAAAGAEARPLARAIVDDLFRALLFRPADADGLRWFTDATLQAGGIADVLGAILGSPEFAARRPRFEAEYLGAAAATADGSGAGGIVPIPPDGPVACSAVQLVLRRAVPLGEAGDRLLVPNDRMILPTVVAEGAWIPGLVDRLRPHIDPGRPYALLDIGANIGLFSRQMLRAFPNITECDCLEPDPGNYAALCFNTAGLPATIRTHPLGLGAEAGNLTFFRDLENCGNFSLHADAMRDRPFEQTAVRIEAAGDWMARNLPGDGPIVWKSDTQGNDEAILAATPWAVWRRVQVAVIELWRIRKGQTMQAAFLDRVADMPNRRIGDRPVSPEDVAAYLASDDWEHEDLFLWR